MTPDLPKKFFERKRLSELTYYRLGGQVRQLHFPNTLAELQQQVMHCAQEEEPLAVIGAGSNVICSDEDFVGTVISCRNLKDHHWLQNGLLHCDAGLSNTEVAEAGLEAGFSDAAWMFRMPGQVGATVRMNARCYGGEISQIARVILTLRLDGTLKVHKAKDVFFGYKETVLMTLKEIVVGAVLAFEKKASTEEILEKMQSHERDRHKKHHFLYPSCGSTFKNNYSIGKPSGQVFDECGLKGLRRGDAAISEHHGNFIFNTGQAQTKDVLHLARHMKQKAVELNPNYIVDLEAQPVGSFESKIATDLNFSTLDRDTQPDPQSPERVLTGLLKKSGERFTPHAPGSPLLPHRIHSLPLLGWRRSDSAALPLVMFHVDQLRPLPQNQEESQGDEPLLRLSFTLDVLESAGGKEGQPGLTPLLSHPPLRPSAGFQDELWKCSAFECFVFNGMPERKGYLETEIHSSTDWLALEFTDTRTRALHSVAPQVKDFPGIVPFRKTSTNQDIIGFELSFSALGKYLHQGQILVRGAYTRQEEVFALAPHPGEASLRTAPNFHLRSDALLVNLS